MKVKDWLNQRLKSTSHPNDSWWQVLESSVSCVTDAPPGDILDVVAEAASIDSHEYRESVLGVLNGTWDGVQL